MSKLRAAYMQKSARMMVWPHRNVRVDSQSFSSARAASETGMKRVWMKFSH